MPSSISWRREFPSGKLTSETHFGDTTNLKGGVQPALLYMKAYMEDGEHLVDLEVRNENQSGLATTIGLATVALPSKA